MHIIIQARISSVRLAGKVLYEIKGKKLLEYIFNRLSFITDSKIIVATSNTLDDDAIENICNENNVECYRGSLPNVSDRFLKAAKYFNADCFVRINGDSPLIDYNIINKAIDIFKENNYDLVTNTCPRSFPIGQSVEVVKTTTLKKIYKKMSTPDHFEHVTKYFYENLSDFKIKNFINNRDLSNYRLVVDTRHDFDRMKKIIYNMDKQHTEYRMDDLIKLYPSN